MSCTKILNSVLMFSFFIAIPTVCLANVLICKNLLLSKSAASLESEKLQYYHAFFSTESKVEVIVGAAKAIDQINGDQFLYEVLEKNVRNARRLGQNEKEHFHFYIYDDLAATNDQSIVAAVLRQISNQTVNASFSDYGISSLLDRQSNLLIKFDEKWNNHTSERPIEGLLKIIEKRVSTDLNNVNTEAIPSLLRPLFDYNGLNAAQIQRVHELSYRLLNHTSSETRRFILLIWATRNLHDLLGRALEGKNIQSENVTKIQNQILEHLSITHLENPFILAFAKQQSEVNPSSEVREKTQLLISSYEFSKQDTTEGEVELSTEEINKVWENILKDLDK
jgi:hypothetical protein